MSITSERIKSLRLEKNMSQNELASKLGIGRSNMGHIENGRVEPTKETLVQLSDIFGVSTDYLLGRTEKKRYYDLTEKDEKDIAKELEEMIADLKSAGAFAYSKETAEVDKETHELLIASLENSLRIAKIEAKKRFTPKKYRD